MSSSSFHSHSTSDTQPPEQVGQAAPGADGPPHGVGNAEGRPANDPLCTGGAAGTGDAEATIPTGAPTDRPDARPPHSAVTGETEQSSVEHQPSAGGPPNLPPEETNARGPSRWQRIRETLPTLGVFALLAGIAAWGHHSNWTMPKFSEITGQAGAEADDWCSEHSVPESQCIACNADLMPKGKLYGWCKEHGVHECVLCNPELAQTNKPADIRPEDLERAQRALAVRPRTKNNPRCKLHLRRIQFASHEAARRAGIDVDVAMRSPIVEVIQANGQIIYDQTRLARLAPRVAGTVWRVDKNVGDPVHQGEVLALIDSVDVGRAKSELLEALAELDLQRATYDRISGLAAKGAVPGKRALEAETAMNQARVRVLRAQQALANLGLVFSIEQLDALPADRLVQHVRFLGLPKEVVASLPSEQATANLTAVFAPLDGVVVRRGVVAGEVVNTSSELFVVADTSRMWIMLDVPLEDAQYVTLGQMVHFHSDVLDQKPTAQITWISTSVDQQTRTVAVRAEVANPDGRLRDETYGTGHIVLREESDAIVVPNESVHWEGCCHVVFVRDKNYLKPDSYKVFHTRSVRVGVKTDDVTEIIAGILPGEVVVTKGSGVLRSELLSANLGAG